MSAVRIADVKQLDLVDFLASLGFHPVKVRNHDYWYLSPLRDERTASFKVDRNRNVWYDHGNGRGGTIIDFGMAYFNCDIPELLQKMEGHLTTHFHHPQQTRQRPITIGSDERKILVVGQRPISNSLLIEYLGSRMISLEEANQFCREITYRVGDRDYTAIGFPNDKGGFELRSRSFKGSSSPKAVTFLPAESSSLRIFEGFFDFLSFQLVQRALDLPPSCFLILNSLTFLKENLPLIRRHSPVLTLLDHDQAGRRATEQIQHEVPGSVDASSFYREAKDLNEWLTKASSKYRQPKDLSTELQRVIHPEILPGPGKSPRRRIR